MKLIQVEVGTETARLLEELTASAAMGGAGTLEGVVRHLLSSAADGVRRPGSWERVWVEQAFGPWGDRG